MLFDADAIRANNAEGFKALEEWHNNHQIQVVLDIVIYYCPLTSNSDIQNKDLLVSLVPLH